MNNMNNFRTLTPEERNLLEKQECRAECWSDVWVKDPFNPDRVRRTWFSGKNYLGVFSEEVSFLGGVTQKAGIYNARLHNCKVGDQVLISNIRDYVANYEIGDHVVIKNAGLVVTDGFSTFGNGVMVNVLDETGGRQLMIYDGLSAHTAYLMAFYRHVDNLTEKINGLISAYAEKVRSECGFIGSGTQISDTGQIVNVRIGENTRICGASRLREGSINSNVHHGVSIGYNVVAENFIVSSGSEISDHAIITHCFVGQGCILSKHYSAIHSLFFCNCQGFNGEACSVFAGPYTVSHHKSTLLIAGMFSFCNAGSGSNQSNHMYKLGPIHHGIVERGSKTTSDSYLLWPAKIGPFTLVMGRHYKNTDTSLMPFSYLIENKDESWLAPGVNLRSVGTIRDAIKWPLRDTRKDPDLLDSINFNLLSPYTIQRMIRGRDILEQIRKISGETTDTYTWETTFIARDSLIRGLELYNKAIVKFLGNSVISRIEKKKPVTADELRRCLEPETDKGRGDWIDASGLIAPKIEIDCLVDRIRSGEISELNELESFFKDLHARYYELEWSWTAGLLEQYTGKKLSDISLEELENLIEHWKESVIGLDKMLYEDARKEFRLSAMTGFGMDGDGQIKEQDFIKVRGTFEKNRFVMEILEHIRKKSELGDKIICLLHNLEN